MSTEIIRNQKGFTLIELIIVLMIISISVGIAGIYIGKSSGGTELRRFAKEIAGIMRYARSHAVSEKKTACLVFDDDDKKIRLYSVRFADGLKDEAEPLITRDFPEGLKVEIIERETDSQFIEFFPYGNTTGGEIRILNDRGTGLAILVNRISGKIEIEKIIE